MNSCKAKSQEQEGRLVTAVDTVLMGFLPCKTSGSDSQDRACSLQQASRGLLQYVEPGGLLRSGYCLDCLLSAAGVERTGRFGEVSVQLHRS